MKRALASDTLVIFYWNNKQYTGAILDYDTHIGMMEDYIEYAIATPYNGNMYEINEHDIIPPSIIRTLEDLVLV